MGREITDFRANFKGFSYYYTFSEYDVIRTNLLTNLNGNTSTHLFVIIPEL